MSEHSTHRVHAGAAVAAMTRELDSADRSSWATPSFQAMSAGSGDCIKILDLDGRLQFMSEGGKRVMEVADFSVLKGCPWPDFWADAGNAEARRAIAEARAGRSYSFHGAADTAAGNHRHWDVHVSPILGEDGRPTNLLSISRDVTDAHEVQSRQRLVAEELQHRMKNTLAMVAAIANQTLRGDDIKARRDIFKARLAAMARAQDILMATNWSERRPRLRRRAGAGGASGKPVPHRRPALAPAVRQRLCRSLWRSTSSPPTPPNTGACERLLGQVRISWEIETTAEDQPAAPRFNWRETGGRPVAHAAMGGFGSRLIDQMLAADLRSAVEIGTIPKACGVRSPRRCLSLAGSA